MNTRRRSSLFSQSSLYSLFLLFLTVVTAGKLHAFAEFEFSSYRFNEGDGRVTLNINRTDQGTGELNMHFRIAPQQCFQSRDIP